VLLGRGGNDRLDGGTGSDTADYTAATAGIVVNMGAAAPQVTIDGEGGQDTLAGIENIAGSNLNDTILGDGNANVLEGNGGNDTLDGVGGNDTASYASATGNVTVLLTIAGPQNTGAAGIDTLSNIENLTGGAFNDTLFGNAEANILRGGAGNDYIQGGAGLDQLFGDAGNDTIEDPDGFALLRAGDGDDVANLSFGNATLTGTSNSWIQMGNGADQINFNFNNTVLQTTRGISTGSNTSTAGAAPDAVEANDGNDVVNLNGSFTANGTYLLTMSGDDQVNANSSTAFGFVHLGVGNDQFNGGNASETVYGGAGNDRIFAQGGNDLMDGGLGNDELDGGGGTDTVSYTATATSNQGGVRVDLAINVAQDTLGAGIDTIRNVENLTGTAFADTLFGNSGANLLNGGAGNDVLEGRLGADQLVGGSGDDRFRWRAANEGGDTIDKFATGGTEDAFEFLASAFPLFHGQAAISIQLDTSVAGDLGSNANVVARSAAGLTTAAAVDAYLAGAAGTFNGGVLVVANGGPGQIARLYYDPDANTTGGAAQAVQLATLNGVTGVSGFTAADFLFV
jgi:Ca2+-binding RTX toxin-like protein